MEDPQQKTIDTIFSTMRRIAVVGISDRPERPSHEVAGYLIAQGFEIVPVNPLLSSVFGRTCYPDLKSIPGGVDVVDIFRRSAEAGAICDEAVAIKARAVWMQEGVEDADAAHRARNCGVYVVMDRCMLKEHARRAAAGFRFA